MSAMSNLRRKLDPHAVTRARKESKRVHGAYLKHKRFTSLCHKGERMKRELESLGYQDVKAA